jgi:hypothetical protein
LISKGLHANATTTVVEDAIVREGGALAALRPARRVWEREVYVRDVA